MGKSLVLAEKPSVGREIARILGCNQSRDGHIVGNQYIVTWALGHLVTLADPEFYGDHWKEWKLETLPMIPNRMELVIMKETSKQYNVVRSLLQSSEVSELIIATDAGREGELVARWIVEKARFQKPMKRLWISSLTDKAIRDGFHNLKPAKDYENLFYSARSRSIADWLVGLNVTRALTCKHNASLSAGRVQTPTLAMIVEREAEIKKFIPKDYYQITAKAGGIAFTHLDQSNQSRIFNKEAADEVVRKVKNANMTIMDIKQTVKSESPPLLYDLTELQRDANRLYAFSAKKTLGLVQRLYENYKYLTYPRTDSKCLSEDMFSTIPDRIKQVGFGEFGAVSRQLLKSPIKKTKRVFDNAKVTDHHAIIPTEENVNESVLDMDEKKVYYLVVKRFLSVFLEDYIYEQTNILATAEKEMFKASGKVVKSSGWKSLYGTVSADEEEEDDSQTLPVVRLKDTYRINSIESKKYQTLPPKRYTEATLLTAMEHPGKFIDDAKMKEIIEKASGIGTPATRADIIERIFSANYVELRGKEIAPTSKGIQLINLVPENMKSPLLTAQWEQQLTLISEGKKRPEVFIKDMEQYAKDLVKDVSQADTAFRHDNMTKTPCPTCGKLLLEVSNKHGKSLVCQDRACGFRKNLTKVSNARCPVCHKNLEIIGSEDKRTYVCKCGFKEKYESFNTKLDERKKDLSKKDVEVYIKKIQNEIPAYSPFAEQLEKLKNKK
jgi:DNA topoisomerase-3